MLTVMGFSGPVSLAGSPRDERQTEAASALSVAVVFGSQSV